MSVDIFNKLPRSPRTPSGRPNVWHFDIRFMQIQPPSHVVFLLQPESSFMHMELVPIGGLPDLGFVFFPDTAKEAATEIAKALVHAFVTGLGSGKFVRNPSPPYAPWSFTTDDQGLAREVGAELKRLGVKAPELCNVKFAAGKISDQARTKFTNMFTSMKTAMGMNDTAHAAFTTPDCISFSSFKLAPWVEKHSEESDVALAYTQRLNSARPTSADKEIDEFMKEPTRLQYGIQCTPSRSLCRQYLIKVILNRKATDAMKSIAHSLLIDWYMKAFQDSTPIRYLHAAAHSADEAVRLASGVASPAVLFFAFYTLEKHASEGQIFELWTQYKHVWKAKHKREEDVAKADNKATLKRMKQPNRYMCANVNCSVSSNSGHMLSKCSGKCDPDKKPSYCGRECPISSYFAHVSQDWKNHKPFCTPGAACSVIERPEVKAKGYAAAKDGAFEVPIKNPDGTTTMISSSTLSPEMLKEMKAYAEATEGSRTGPGFSFGSGLSIGMSRINLGDAEESTLEID
ncbi:hypothetical protein DFH09DRAFT_904206 [Mycena vulgaris]|nr:hypothetical protein DFH09DRAFT_904206 [Mycena vulgaris]